ncbi:MAG: APC family permease [Fimbriimonadaceae bacterium]|nr:APC family permease [Fimbriimonadaceae bacterium]
MSVYSKLKRVLIGDPIQTKHAHHERLPKVFGLPVFASDALSSVAYATEEILLVLMLAGAAAMPFVFDVSWWLGGLMLLIAFSYYQTIHAYPKGGGTYLVSTENLGSGAGKIAGGSLLIDYVLTVAVSVSSGVNAIISLYADTKPYAVGIGVAAICILMIANLRGAKESGMLFAIPTYTFVFLVLALIFKGVVDTWGVPHHVATGIAEPNEGWHAVNAFLLLRAFAASCTALTGTEAIADGVQAFRPPEAKNAALTLMMMVGLLMTMFIGLSYLAMHEGIVPMAQEATGYKTVVAQIADKHFSYNLFYAMQLATALILFLAANTAYADFPRLCSFVAKDGFLPRQLGTVGDRLVYQNGIVLLSLAAIGLIVVYNANTHSLIPLYAMGVFISFTMSQAGMCLKFKREGSPAWKTILSGVGAAVTFVVLGILLYTKFAEGAWLIVVALTVLLIVFSFIRKHYNYLAKELSVEPDDKIIPTRTTVMLLVPRLHKGILQAISYAQAMTKDVRAIHVTLDPSNVSQIKQDWTKFGADMPLVILESPYRSLVTPIVEYIDQTLAEDPDLLITVIVPQAVPKNWVQSLLHSNAAVPLKIALAKRKNVVITNVRYFLK